MWNITIMIILLIMPIQFELSLIRGSNWSLPMKARVINLELACFNSILNSRLETCFRGPSRPSIEQVLGRNQKPQKRGSSRTILSCKFSFDDHPFFIDRNHMGVSSSETGGTPSSRGMVFVNGKIPSFDSWMITGGTQKWPWNPAGRFHGWLSLFESGRTWWTDTMETTERAPLLRRSLFAGIAKWWFARSPPVSLGIAARMTPDFSKIHWEAFELEKA